MSVLAMLASVNAALLLVSAGTNYAEAHDYKMCKTPSVDELGVKELLFVPDPPQPGKMMTVDVKGVPTRSVSEGQIHVDVKVMGVKVASETMDLCSMVKCPLVAGEEFQVQISQQIPGETPEKIAAEVKVSVSTGGSTISCLESTVRVGSAAAAAAAAPEGQLLQSSSSSSPRLTLLKHEAEFLFDRWKTQFPQAHPRWEVFLENLERILKHNADKDKTYEMALNEFASMTPNEFLATRLGYRRPEAEEKKKPAPAAKTTKEDAFVLRASVAQADPPLSFDWETKGAVTPVKNQGSCGSCWAFSAVAALESAYFLKTGKLVQFSEQELVSCDMELYGCQGGLMDPAFDWTRLNGGLCSEEAYPYTSGTTSARGICSASTCAPVEGSAPAGFVDVPHNEASLLQALFEHGPLSVAIEADETGFQFYHKGVMSAHCGSRLDHGVLLVGYGVDPESKQAFWRIKNSWGAGWGEEGYIRILRGKRWGGPECGIASAASYPVF